ncbi:hypothetical protein CHLRE_16g676150v5 [Chlamydomonas reinhardtii]|uniref:superoxide dismutase n=1 Tax=Chlamydomonas reinhardtii TaxID=3055 RepID=A8J3M8_CHLRE|nr:uncharacterized protein CHLRE_16g676150v5 [Chlamydomonas reinhardtii]ACV53111.1 chloroplast Mn superoxide dismutase precursor [Chlamydomonas reinhardtii]PNW72243.1 hypothetical protein CHLRE_16g676150v5 [Chlamydomonas reinhardtii]|eukprot:XP_001695947.1 superoxide dismutase [Mn] [Chlamydomonas reinhardtii]
MAGQTRALLASQLAAAALLVCAVLASATKRQPYPVECQLKVNGTYAIPGLPLAYDAYMPAIDNETMFLHSQRHVGAAVTSVNSVLARYPELRELSLSEIVSQIGTRRFNRKYAIAAADSTALRNNAGSLWNHAHFWRIMTTFNSSNPATVLTDAAPRAGVPSLKAAIAAKWGNATALLDSLRATGAGVFGSGWAWLVVRPQESGKGFELAIVPSPNQDNPLMDGYTTDKTRRGVPILGVDVWEHAYYLRYRNVRASYLSSWVGLVDWAAVQRNYGFAVAGRVDAMLC